MTTTARFPKISVVTVCFNSAATLEATLASVAEQTWRNVEHVVVDGGSTDTSMQIVNRHRARLAAVVSEPDRGIYDAMNKGLRLASGDYVAFLNSDDVYVDARVLESVADALSDGQLDAVFGDVDFVRADAPTTAIRRFDSSRFSPDRLGYGWMMAHPALFIRKSVFETVGHFRDDYRIAGDFEFIARAFKNGGLRYRYLPRSLVHMKLGGASTNGWKSFVLRNSEVLRACRENNISSSWLKILSKYPLKLREYFLK